jgi:hypothetical protein
VQLCVNAGLAVDSKGLVYTTANGSLLAIRPDWSVVRLGPAPTSGGVPADGKAVSATRFGLVNSPSLGFGSGDNLLVASSIDYRVWKLTH